MSFNQHNAVAAQGIRREEEDNKIPIGFVDKILVFLSWVLIIIFPCCWCSVFNTIRVKFVDSFISSHQYFILGLRAGGHLPIRSNSRRFSWEKRLFSTEPHRQQNRKSRRSNKSLWHSSARSNFTGRSYNPSWRSCALQSRWSDKCRQHCPKFQPYYCKIDIFWKV